MLQMYAKANGEIYQKICISSTQPRVIEWLHAKYDGTIFKIQPVKNCKQRYYWESHAGTIQELLSHVDGLVVKQQEIEVVKEFRSTMRPYRLPRRIKHRREQLLHSFQQVH
jgi:hypothetical protein